MLLSVFNSSKLQTRSKNIHHSPESHLGNRLLLLTEEPARESVKRKRSGWGITQKYFLHGNPIKAMKLDMIVKLNIKILAVYF